MIHVLVVAEQNLNIVIVKLVIYQIKYQPSPQYDKSEAFNSLHHSTNLTTQLLNTASQQISR